MIPDLFRVSAGGDVLRQFFTKRGAAQYAAEVLVSSAANIGRVLVEARSAETARWHTVVEMGVPERQR
jgi:hypothetical protein